MPKQNTLVHDFSSKDSGGYIRQLFTEKWTAIFIGGMLVLGLTSGYFFARVGQNKLVKEADTGGKLIQSDKVVGSTDTTVFKDSAEGLLEKGGIDGEGTHHLIREGGPSQTAYLTSSVIDLDKFVGKEVKVWGETFQAEKAGWLMDVGRVELLK